MGFFGSPVRRPVANEKRESSTEDAVPAKIRQDLSRFEQSIKDMQSCLKSLNENLTDVYGETLPRVNEFRRALQDENTLLDNFASDVHQVEEPLRTFEHKYDGGSLDSSGLSGAKRKSEFVGTVLGTLFHGQNVFFSESFKVSQVLLDIVSQTKHLPTPREARIAKELAEQIVVKTESRQSLETPARASVAGGVSPFSQDVGHRGQGSLVGGAYGSQQPQTRSTPAQVKPASRFSSPQSTRPAPARIYV